MEDVKNIFKDTYNLYQKHKEETDWNQWPKDLLNVVQKHKDSLLCAEIVVAINRHMERREENNK